MEPEAIQDLRNLPEKSRRRVWKSFMEKYKCQKIAEVGVFKGQNLELMVEHRPFMAFAVDIWKEEGVPGQNDADLSQEELDDIYRQIEKQTLYTPFLKLIRDYTTKAAEIFPDEFFDLVYLDADHTYEAVKKDLEAWYPKIRKGGFFVGDDYLDRWSPKRHVRFGVVRAVNEFAEKNNLTVHELPLHGWAIIK